MFFVFVSLLFSLLVCRDPKQCSNEHLFCSRCILTWSLSFNNENHSKCPVCRAAGRYRTRSDVASILSKKHVTCPHEKCKWTGKLVDFQWHERSHPPHPQPPLPSVPAESETPYTVTSPRVAGRGGSMREQLNSFQRRLENGFRGIQHHYAQSERERQASMAEVDRLSERLGDVAQNLDVLMGSMQQNSERLRRYLSDNPPDPALPGDESDEDDLDLLLTNDIMTSRRESRNEIEARLDRIFADDVDDYDDVMHTPAATTTAIAAVTNPFVLPAHMRRLDGAIAHSRAGLPVAMVRRSEDIEAHVERLLQEPTPEDNPYRLPVELPELRNPATLSPRAAQQQHTHAQTSHRLLRRRLQATPTRRLTSIQSRSLPGNQPIRRAQNQNRTSGGEAGRIGARAREGQGSIGSNTGRGGVGDRTVFNSGSTLRRI